MYFSELTAKVYDLAEEVYRKTGFHEAINSVLEEYRNCRHGERLAILKLNYVLFEWMEIKDHRHRESRIEIFTSDPNFN